MSGNGASGVGLVAGGQVIREVIEQVRPGCGLTAPADAPFVSLGISSLDAVAIARALGSRLHREIPATILWDQPTIRALSAALARDASDRSGPQDTPEPAEPIAIVGIGCRFPGCAGPAEFYELLRSGYDPVAEVPPQRWDVERYYDPDPATPGTAVSRWGGFIDQLDQFDAGFFGMSPREAAQLDPRQRLTLECAWEALEDAGIPADSLSGSNTGVFMATLASNYGSLVFDQHLEIVDAYSGTGNGNSVLANRLSFQLDLRGPSVALDTACSGSLVTVHLASNALRARECDLVLAGGVNVILKPDETVFFAKTGALSPDGRCAVFDASANGIVRSEGCGVVVLKRLADAQRDGDRVYAVILGSAVNQDGSSNGIMAPSRLAQEQLLLSAYRSAGVDPAAVQYVEAHGTGTALGDPIEVGALASVLAEGRPADRPLAIGSAKSNIGHTEAAAGVAGLIKVALSMWRGAVPGNLHYRTPNPLLELDSRPLRIMSTTSDWPAPADGGPRVAGVSAFGFAGTNAHVVLSQAPAPESATSRRPHGPALLALSARSQPALADLAGAYARLLVDLPADQAAQVMRAAATQRTHHEHRMAVTGSPAELPEALAAYAGGQLRPGVTVGRRPHAGAPPLAWLFSGQGSHWPGMGRQLLAEDAFRATLEQCEAVVRDWSGRSLLADLAAPAGRSLLDRTAIGQPGVVAVQLGLSALWQHWGILPDVIVGQSLGELAAAAAAGVLDLDDAMLIACARSAAMAAAEGAGMTASIGLPAQRAAELVAGRPGTRVAGVLSGSLTLVSGPTESMTDLLAQCERDGTFARALPGVRIALHGYGLAEVADQLRGAVAGIRPRRPQLPLVLARLGGPVGARELDPDYWVESMCQPFDLVGALDSVVDLGVTDLLEINAHPLLRSAVADAGERAGQPVRHFASLVRGTEELSALADGLGLLYCAGAQIDWLAVTGGRGQLADLPSYPWQRERYWYDQLLRGSGAARGGEPAAAAGRHPLLGPELDLAGVSGTRVWQNQLDPGVLPLLAHHRVHGQPVLPGAALVELMLAAAGDALGDTPVLADVEFVTALPLAAAPQVQVTLRQPDVIEVASRVAGAGGWVLNARSRWLPPQGDTTGAADSPATATDDPLADPITDVEQLYRSLAEIGLEYGGPFRSVQSIAADAGGLTTLVEVPASQRWVAHPAAIDGCLQSVAALSARDAQMRLPSRIERVELVAGLPELLSVRVRPRGALDGPRVVVDIELRDAAGQLVGLLTGATFDAVGAGATTGDPLSDWFLAVDWVEQPNPSRPVRQHADLPTPDAALAGFAARSQELAAELGLGGFEPRSAFSELVAAYCRDACGQVSADQVVPAQRRLWSRVTELAVGASGRPVPELVAQLRAGHPDADLELAVLERSGRALPALLRGELEASELLFGSDGGQLLARFYGESLWMRYFNAALAEVTAAAAAGAPQAALRVLEIGAGTGATTAHLLAALPVDGVEYTVSDISPALVAGTQDRFGDDPRVHYRVLDVEESPPADLRGRFDLVVAANVLHATVDLSAAVANALACLRPGGLLVALEGSGEQPWLDVVVGATDGWWRAQDQLRAGYPLVTPEQWRDLLVSAGCEQVSFAPAPADAPQLVVVARAPEAEDRRWLVVGAGDPLDAALVAVLRARGERAAICGPADLGAQLAPGTRVVCTQALATPAWEGLTAGALAAGEDRAGWDSIAAVAQVAATGVPARVHLVSRGAQAAGPGEVPAIAQAAAWGVGRVVAAEHPELWGGLVDLDPVAPLTDQADALAAELLGQTAPDQVALRAGTRLVARLHRVELPADGGPPLRPDATYLITGGIRGIGLEVAGSLVDRGARHLLLLARTQLPPRATWGALDPDHPRRAEVDSALALERRGASVTVAQADVSDAEALRAVLAEHARSGRPPVRGVVHAAGLIDDALISKLTRKQFQDVARVKSVGSWNLHEQLGPDLDFLVLFSSGTSLLGTFGQANYAAGNAVMDALAHARRALGLPATSINWGVWRDTGIVARRGSSQALARNGLVEIPTELGLAACHRALASGMAQVAALPTDWNMWRQIYPAGSEQPLFCDLVAEFDAAQAPVTADREVLDLRTIPAGPARAAAAEGLVRGILGAVMRRAPDSVDLEASLTSLGMDSIMAVEIRNAISGAGGPTVSIVDLLAGMTGRVLAHRIAAQGDGVAPAPIASADRGNAGAAAVYQATPGQEALWLAEQAAGARDATYSVPVVVELRERLDPQLLAAALAQVLARHDVLRARFQPGDRGLSLVIAEPGPADLEVLPGAQLGAAGSDQREQALRTFASQPFDLAAGPLCRFLLIDGPARSTFALSIHHGVFDGWSAGVFVADLAAAYERIAAGGAAGQLPAPPQFAEHAMWSAEPAQQATRATDVEQVVAKLSGRWVPEVLELDYPRPLRPSRRGAKLPFDLPEDLAQAVTRAARAANTTPFCVLLAGLAATLAGPDGGGVVIGTTPSSRPYPRAAGMIGYFVDTVLIPLSVSREATFAELVQQCHAAMLDAFAHSAAPLDAVLAKLSERVGPARVEVVLTLQNSPDATPDLVESVRTIDNGTAKFDLVLNLTEAAGGYRGWFEYATDVLRGPSVAELGARLAALLAEGCAAPDAPLLADRSLL